MSNELKTIESQQLAKITTEPTPEQMNAWSVMVRKKNELTHVLTTSELELQQILLSVDVKDHKSIDEALANYRKKHGDLKENRLNFTRLIEEKLFAPLMAFEKRAEPKTNEQYLKLDITSLELRKGANEAAAKKQAYENEKARFLAHCANEFMRIEAQYINELNNQIDTAYSAFLTAAINPPPISNVEVNMGAVKVGQMNKFDPALLTKEDMQALYLTLTPTQYIQILADKIAMLPQVFANYEVDLANSSAAIERRELDAKIASQEAAAKLEAEASVNNLIATASGPQIETAKIKKELKIEPINTQAWAQLIMTQFIANLPTLVSYLRVKTWANLSIQQMADAIAKYATETGETFKGVVYTEILK
jgi:hypothetical protein